MNREHSRNGWFRLSRRHLFTHQTKELFTCTICRQERNNFFIALQVSSTLIASFAALTVAMFQIKFQMIFTRKFLLFSLILKFVFIHFDFSRFLVSSKNSNTLWLVCLTTEASETQNDLLAQTNYNKLNVNRNRTGRKETKTTARAWETRTKSDARRDNSDNS